MLTASARDVLIEHIDGLPVPYRKVSKTGTERHEESCRLRTVTSLLMRRLIRLCNVEGHFTTKECTHTIITDAGRESLCRILGEYADALSRAGFGEPHGSLKDAYEIGSRFYAILTERDDKPILENTGE